MILSLGMLLLLLIAVSFLENVISSDCWLEDRQMSKRWIYLTRPSGNTFDVLHADYIRDGASLYLFCKPGSSVKEKRCEDGKLREVQHRPIICIGRLRADIELTMIATAPCRRLGGLMYNVVYNLSNDNRIRLYQVCYSTRNEKAVFTRHKAYGFDLPAPGYKRPQFTRGTVVSRQRVESFTPSNVYKKFVEHLGEGQTYIPTSTSLIVERGHLVNAQDFPTYDQMDATFKYINVAPQFRASNRMNWRRIENWIHNLPNRDEYADVVTGVYGILSLPHSTTGQLVDIYLMDNNKNPIPLWTYKVVKYQKMCFAFVTLNNPFNTDPNIRTNICETIACPNGLQLTNAPGSTVAYCCNYNQLVRYVGQHARLC